MVYTFNLPAAAPSAPAKVRMPNPMRSAITREKLLNATIECNPLLGPQLMTSVTEVVSGRPIPKRMVVEERMFTMDMAKQFLPSRKY